MDVPFVKTCVTHSSIAGTGFTFRLNFGGSNKNINAIDNYCVYIGELETSVTDSQLYSIFKEKYISFCGAKVVNHFFSQLDHA